MEVDGLDDGSGSDTDEGGSTNIDEEVGMTLDEGWC